MMIWRRSYETTIYRVLIYNTKPLQGVKMNYCKNCTNFSRGRHNVYGEERMTYYCNHHSWVIFNRNIKARLSFMTEDCKNYKRKLRKKSYFDWLFRMVIPSFFSRNRERCNYIQYKGWNINGRETDNNVGCANSCVQEQR